MTGLLPVRMSMSSIASIEAMGALPLKIELGIVRSVGVGHGERHRLQGDIEC